MRNITDEAFLVQAYQRFAERAQPDGEGREQSAAGEDRALVFVQEQQDLNLELAQPDPRAGIADRTREASIRLDLMKSRARGIDGCLGGERIGGCGHRAVRLSFWLTNTLSIPYLRRWPVRSMTRCPARRTNTGIQERPTAPLIPLRGRETRNEDRRGWESLVIRLRHRPQNAPSRLRCVFRSNQPAIPFQISHSFRSESA